MSWLEKHLEEFVRPVTGDFDETPLGYFRPEEITIIKNAWRAVKRNAKGKKIFLPGRDVWVFEVLARREDYPTLFMPECSRQTVHQILKNNGLFHNIFLFDTGFIGSIPKGLKIKKFGLMSYENRENVGVQVFPKLTMSRSLSLYIEKTPKYWESGRLGENNEIIQPQADLYEFMRAARVTIEIYKSSSPKFIGGHKPIQKRGVFDAV